MRTYSLNHIGDLTVQEDFGWMERSVTSISNDDAAEMAGKIVKLAHRSPGPVGTVRVTDVIDVLNLMCEEPNFCDSEARHEMPDPSENSG